jgi:HEAT repeat protein
MRPSVVSLLLAMVSLGCHRADIPPGKYFHGQPVEYWLEAIKSPNPQTRKKAADVLGNVGPIDPRAIPALIEAVRDKDPLVRDAAVLALSKIGPAANAAETALQQATQDTDKTVRTHAAMALERVRGIK